MTGHLARARARASALLRRAWPSRRAVSPPTSPPGSGRRCRVCGCTRLRTRNVRRASKRDLVCRVRICRDCGYVHMPGKKSTYRTKSSIDELSSGGARIGSPETAGREFHMARMALDILGRDDVEVLVYGAGRSQDNHHIAGLPEVRGVAIGDIMRLRDDAEFIDANQPAQRRFSVVVASEVVEHFRRPRADFARLFGFVEDDGLLVCGTNIYAGGKLARDQYIFYPDHTSYYTPEALRRIASDAGFLLDFRAPLLGAGMRKRYVLLSRSPEVMQSAACYFGAELFAPSEKARPARPPARRHRRPDGPDGTASTTTKRS